MKKILMGLVALSVTTFALPQYANPQDNTLVWETGGNGKIAVTATITSEPTKVKYVVFASNDDAAADVQDSLILSKFIISENADKNIFDGTNPKVFVKRVNSTDNGYVALEPTDKVAFKLVREGGFDSAIYNSVLPDWITVGKNTETLATFFVVDSELTTLIDGMGLVLSQGLIYKATTGRYKAYMQPNVIDFNHKENGVLEIGTRTRSTIGMLWDPFTAADPELAKLNKAFAKDISGTAISIEAKIN